LRDGAGGIVRRAAPILIFVVGVGTAVECRVGCAGVVGAASVSAAAAGPSLCTPSCPEAPAAKEFCGAQAPCHSTGARSDAAGQIAYDGLVFLRCNGFGFSGVMAAQPRGNAALERKFWSNSERDTFTWFVGLPRLPTRAQAMSVPD